MSPKSPRNVSGKDLIKVLSKYGYSVVGKPGAISGYLLILKTASET
jgi:hypothetical protein